MAQSRWGRGWSRWKRVAEKVGRVQAFVIFSIVYFLLAAPVGLVYRSVADPLLVKARGGSFWQPCAAVNPSLEAARRQS